MITKVIVETGVILVAAWTIWEGYTAIKEIRESRREKEVEK